MDEDRRDQLSDVVRRGAVLLVGFAVVLALGTYLLVHALGLNSSGQHSGPVAGEPAPPTPLPTTALPVPKPSDGGSGSDHSPSATPNPSDGVSVTSRPGPRHHAQHGLQLNLSPPHVGPMERINLTGIWPGHDNVTLQVQRRENGRWGDFPVTTHVDMGTFATYVQSGRRGVNAFRVVDPSTGTASNLVSVTVG